MNRDEIMNMQPGRKLDVLVAEKVFGKLITNVEYQYRDNEKGFDLVPEYSSDITAAWEVVENMRTKHKQFITIFDNPHLNYDVRFSGNKSSEYERLSSLPHAICRAALLSLIQEDTP